MKIRKPHFQKWLNFAFLLKFKCYFRSHLLDLKYTSMDTLYIQKQNVSRQLLISKEFLISYEWPRINIFFTSYACD